MAKYGNCYAVTEAAWHILGGKRGDWHVCRMKIGHDRRSHWFLRHKQRPDIILDLSRLQFGGALPCYGAAIRAGFLTQQPSKKARALIEAMTWQEVQP